jgi:hypothetical protein
LGLRILMFLPSVPHYVLCLVSKTLNFRGHCISQFIIQKLMACIVSVPAKNLGNTRCHLFQKPFSLPTKPLQTNTCKIVILSWGGTRAWWKGVGAWMQLITGPVLDLAWGPKICNTVTNFAYWIWAWRLVSHSWGWKDISPDVIYILQCLLYTFCTEIDR